jgi:hypothetical protein
MGDDTRVWTTSKFEKLATFFSVVSLVFAAFSFWNSVETSNATKAALNRAKAEFTISVLKQRSSPQMQHSILSMLRAKEIDFSALEPSDVGSRLDEILSEVYPINSHLRLLSICIEKDSCEKDISLATFCSLAKNLIEFEANINLQLEAEIFKPDQPELFLKTLARCDA